MTTPDTSERIRQVRKHGSLTVPTRDEALAIVAAAREAGYRFAQQQRTDGFTVSDLDDPVAREDWARHKAERNAARRTRVMDTHQPAAQPQLDITIGEVRVVIRPHGLIGLHRGDDEHLTLIPSEARDIAALLLAQLGAPADGHRISDRQ